jgi:hypothetical protein
LVPPHLSGYSHPIWRENQRVLQPIATRFEGTWAFYESAPDMDESAKDQLYGAAVQKHGNPIRVLAESAILRYIGELRGDAEIRYQEMNRVCFPDMDGIGEFEVGASVTLAQIEGIQKLWRAEKATNPGLTPTTFARDNAQGVFCSGIEICDP